MGKFREQWTVGEHGPLVELADRILTATGVIPMPLGKFPRRMTVVGLAGERTAIFSAMALDEPSMARIEALGRPAYLIVPNAHHRFEVGVWKKRYPDARVIAPRGAIEAVAEAVTVDATGEMLDDEARLVSVGGTAEREGAMLVRRGEGVTLIVNDIIAHVAHPPGLGAHIMARLFGFGVAAPAVPRIVKRILVKDRAALAGQFRKWADEPNLKRIVPSHGKVIDRDPSGVLRGLADRLD